MKTGVKLNSVDCIYLCTALMTFLLVSTSCDAKKLDCEEIEISVREHEEWEMEEFKEFCENLEEAQTNSSLGLPVIDKNFCGDKGFDLSHLRIVFTIFLTFAYGALVRTLLRIAKLNIPYTVVIFLTGNIVGVLSRQIGSAFRSYTEMARIPPQIYLFIFLPVLVFESAFSLNPHTFYRAFVQIVILAFPGMVIATFMAAYLSQVILSSYEWTFAEAFWFGSIASATDPVAVVAILRELGASEVLGILIEGESLLNDGVAVLMFDILEELLTCQIKINLSLYVLWKFCQITLGGPIFGYVMARIAVVCLSNTFNDSTIEITITLVAAYLTYYISEDILGVSGILAVVALGVTINAEKTCISPEVESQMHHFWEMVGFLANTAVFMIIGIIVTETGLNYVTPQDWIYLVYLYFVQNLIRLVMLIMLYPFLSRFGYGITWRNLLVMVWGGLRGAVGTCLALEVYENEHLCQHLNLGPKFLFQTAGNVFLTLLINATTTKPLLKALKLIEVSPGGMQDMAHAVNHLELAQSRAIRALKHSSPMVGANWSCVQEYTTLVNPYKKTTKEKSNDIVKNNASSEQLNSRNSDTNRKDLSSIEREILMEEARVGVLRAMKVSFWRQFEHGLLIEMALLELISAAAEAQAKPLKLIYTQDLSKYWSIDSYSPGSPLAGGVRKLKKLVLPNASLDTRLNSKLFSGYEIGKGFIFGLTDAIKFLPQIIENSKIFTKINRVLLDERIDARRELGVLQKHHPEIGNAVKTRHASRLVLNQMRETLVELKKVGLLDKEDWNILLSQVEGKIKRLFKMSKSISPNPPESTLINVSWIRGNEETYEFFIENAELLTFTFGDTICGWNELPNGIFIIILGMVKIEYIPSEEMLFLSKTGDIPNTELILDSTFCTRGNATFFTGTVIGEKGVLTGQRRAAAVTCETTVHAYHISESIMRMGMTRFHSLEERLWRAVGMRLAYAILPTHPKYSEWNTDKLHIYIERCRVPVDSMFDTMWIEDSIAEILIIQGKVKDTLSGETFTAPQLVPRRVSKIMLVHTPKLKTRILVILSYKASVQSIPHGQTFLESLKGPEDCYF